MNISSISSLNSNKNTDNLKKREIKKPYFNTGKNFYIGSYPKSYYLNQISFGKQIQADRLISKIGEDNFPNHNILQKLKELAKSRDYSLYDIHINYYKDLLDCSTLKEAKEKYPEFAYVIDAKDIDVDFLDKQSALYKISKGDIEGINIEDLSLEFLKKYYAKLQSIKKREVYWGLTGKTIIKIAESLNIKLFDIKYMTTAAHQKDEYRKKLSQKTEQQWQDAEYREKQLRLRGNEEFRARLSQMQIQEWQNPDSTYNSDKFRAKLSQTKIQIWQDPKYREKQLQTRSSEEFKEKQSQALSEVWQNPKYREKKIKALIEKWQDPESGYNSQEFKEKQAAASARVWQDPKHIEKMAIIYKAKSEAYKRHPEITNMMSEVGKSFCWLGELLDKKRNGIALNEEERAYLLAFFRECEKRIPGYSKIIGKEQHKILVEWGVLEN